MTTDDRQHSLEPVGKVDNGFGVDSLDYSGLRPRFSAFPHSVSPSLAIAGLAMIRWNAAMAVSFFGGYYPETTAGFQSTSV